MSASYAALVDEIKDWKALSFLARARNRRRSRCHARDTNRRDKGALQTVDR